MADPSEVSGGYLDESSCRRSTRKRKLTDKNQSTTPKRQKRSSAPSSSWRSSPPIWQSSPATQTVTPPVNEHDTLHKPAQVKQEPVSTSVEDDSLRRSSRKKRPTEKAGSPAPYKPRPYHRQPSLSIHASPVRGSSSSFVDLATQVVSQVQVSLPAENSCAQTTKVTSATTLSPSTPGEESLGPDLQLLWTGKVLRDSQLDQILKRLQGHDAWPLSGDCDLELGRWYLGQLSSAICQHKIPPYSDASAQMEFFSCISRLCKESFDSSVSSAVAKANSELRVEWKIREEEDSVKRERAERKKAKQRLEAAKRMHSKTPANAEAADDDDDESEGAIMKSIIDAMQQKVEAVNQGGRKDNARLARKKWLGFVTTFLANAETTLNELEGYEEQATSLPSPENSQKA